MSTKSTSLIPRSPSREPSCGTPSSGTTDGAPSTVATISRRLRVAVSYMKPGMCEPRATPPSPITAPRYLRVGAVCLPTASTSVAVRTATSVIGQHSSRKRIGGLAQDVLGDRERLHCQLFRDHERRIDADFRIVDHRQHAAREARVEDLARDLLVEERVGAGLHDVEADHETPAACILDDGDLTLPALHLGQHLLPDPA